MAVVYGYEDGGSTLIVDDYMDKQKRSQHDMTGRKSVKLPIEKLGPLQTYLGEHRQPPPARKALRTALHVALLNWRRAKHHGGLGLREREYWYGEAALNAWIGDLRECGSYNDEARKALSGLDPWVFTQLHDARKAAAKFLKDWSVILDDEGREALEKAAALYQEEVDTLDTLLPTKRDEEGTGADLSAESREREIEVLTQARDLEAKAIEQVEKALATLG
jgi:hypothetical protein